jgi:hypothetical protein
LQLSSIRSQGFQSLSLYSHDPFTIRIAVIDSSAMSALSADQPIDRLIIDIDSDKTTFPLPTPIAISCH